MVAGQRYFASPKWHLLQWHIMKCNNNISPVRPVSPTGTCAQRQQTSKNSSVKDLHYFVKDTPAEGYAQRRLLETVISGKSVGSECPSHRPLLQHSLHHRKALSLWYRRRRSHRRPQRSLGCSIGHTGSLAEGTGRQSSAPVSLLHCYP